MKILKNIILLLLIVLFSANLLTAKRDFEKFSFLNYSNYYSKIDSQIKTYNDFKNANNLSVKCTLNLENNPTCMNVEENRSGEIFINYRMGNFHYKMGSEFDNTNKYNSKIGVKVNALDNNGLITNLLDKYLEVRGDQVILRPEHTYRIKLSDMVNIGISQFERIEIEIYSCDSLFIGNMINKSSELTFEVFYTLDRKYKAIDINNPAIPITNVEYAPPINNQYKYKFQNDGINNQFRTLRFAWKTTCEEFEFEKYNFQLLKLENTKGEIDEFITEVDWNKSLNIEVGNYEKFVDLYISQGSGFYIWRVRPVGTWFEGGMANSNNFGLWNSQSMNQGQIFDLSNSSPSPAYYFFEYQQADSNINWIHARFFNETDKGETKYFDEITYSDDLLGKRQYQKRINSVDYVIISEYIPDYSGEIVVSSLPAAVAAEDVWWNEYSSVPISKPEYGVDLKYKRGSLLVSGGNKLNVSDFDNSDPIIANSTVNSSTAIADGYIQDYYDENVIFGLPNSQQYPYSRSIYYNDGSGRLKEQRFPGEVSHTSTSTEQYGRVMTFYSSVSEEELIPIFGKETPDDSKMFKVITVDQNGVFHITYKEFNGNTIATAVMSDQYKNNNNLEPLANSTQNEHELGENGFLRYNILDEIEKENLGKTHFTSEKEIFINDPINTRVTYGIKPKAFKALESCKLYDGNLIIGDKILNIPMKFKVTILNENDYFGIPAVHDYSATTLNFSSVIPSTGIHPLVFDLLGDNPTSYKFSRSLTFDRNYIFEYIEDYRKDIINHFYNDISGFKNEIEYLNGLLDGNISSSITEFRTKLNNEWGWSEPNPIAETDLEKNFFSKEIYNTCGFNIKAYLPKDPCKEESACGDNPDYEKQLFDLFENRIVKIIDEIEFDNNGYVIEKEDDPGYDPNNDLNPNTITSFKRDLRDFLFRNGESIFDGVELFNSTNVDYPQNGVLNRMIENMLSETYVNSYVVDNEYESLGNPIWTEDEICDCWKETLTKFEVNGIKTLEISDGVYADFFDKKFSLIDEFLACTGTNFQGYTNTRFDNPTNLSVAQTVLHCDPNALPSFGQGWIENAYKFLPYEFTSPLVYGISYFISLFGQNVLNSPTEQFFDKVPNGTCFDYTLKSYLPDDYIYLNWAGQNSLGIGQQTIDEPKSPNYFFLHFPSNSTTLKDAICNNNYTTELNRIYNYYIGKEYPLYCPNKGIANNESAEEFKKRKEDEFKNKRDKGNKESGFDDITDPFDPFYGLTDGIKFDSWQDALLFYVDGCNDMCTDEKRKFEYRIRNALRNHVENYIVEGSTRWISDFGEFDQVNTSAQTMREFGTTNTIPFSTYNVKVFTLERLADYVTVLQENCKKDCTPNCFFGDDAFNGKTLDEFLHDSKSNTEIFDVSSIDPIDIDCLMQDLERIKMVTTSDYELQLPQVSCDGFPTYCEVNDEIEGYIVDDWKSLWLTFQTVEGEKVLLPYPEEEYRRQLIVTMNNALRKAQHAAKANVLEFEKGTDKKLVSIYTFQNYRNKELRFQNRDALMNALVSFDGRIMKKFAPYGETKIYNFNNNSITGMETNFDYLPLPDSPNEGKLYLNRKEIEISTYEFLRNYPSIFDIPKYWDPYQPKISMNMFTIYPPNQEIVIVDRKKNNKKIFQEVFIYDDFSIEDNILYYNRKIKGYNHIWNENYWNDANTLNINGNNAPVYLNDYEFQLSGLHRFMKPCDGCVNDYNDIYNITYELPYVRDFYTTSYDGKTSWTRNDVEGSFSGRGAFAEIPEYPEFDIDSTDYICFRWISVDPENSEIDLLPPNCEEEEPIQYITALETQIKDIAELLTKNLMDNIFDGLHDYVFEDREPDATGVPLDTFFVTTKSDILQKYTLYYYDISNNLVKTVAPAGVTVDKNRTRNDIVQHNFESKYKYNSQGQMIESKSPDQNPSGPLIIDGNSFVYDGETIYIYDLAGRIRITVNPKQIYNTDNDSEDGIVFAPKATYFKYDNRGRLIESGEFTGYYDKTGIINSKSPYLTLGNYIKRHLEFKQQERTTSTPNPDVYDSLFKYKRNFEKYLLDNVNYPSDRDENSSYKSNDFPHNLAYINRLSPVNHIYRKIGLKTITLYDTPDINFPAVNFTYGVSGQKYLVNRISSITRIPNSEWEGMNNFQKDRVTSYYSYDPHGNVDWYYQEILPGRFNTPGLGTLVTYEYDLLSGNVHELNFQPQHPDEFTQYFKYDADNRIIDVSSSRHGIIAEGDSKYEYYPHGPLQRRSVGTDSLQGLDYYYTLQGWLKGINSISNITVFDTFGKDAAGGLRRAVGKDIYSMNLNYYKTETVSDYESDYPMGTSFYNDGTNLDNNLYDGNISSWNNVYNATTYPEVNSMNGVLDRNETQYKYDKAGRLVHSYIDTNFVNKVDKNTKYQTDYNYDLNGNMKTISRLDGTSNLTLTTNTFGSAPMSTSPNNQLITAFTPSGGPTLLNYDRMGNLAAETNPMSGLMNQIYWTADGKLATTKKNVKVIDSVTHFEHELSLYQHYYYDGMGNRVLKIGNGKLNPEDEGTDPIILHCDDHIGGMGCAPCHESLNMRAYYYGREAGGKVLATYNTTPEGLVGQGSSCYAPYYYLDLEEWYVYGSESDGRISVLKPYANEFTDHLHINNLHLYDQAEPLAMKDTIIYYGSQNIGTYQTNERYLGNREYEIKDHLGNVRVVISDIKNPLNKSIPINSWTFKANIRNLSNYYPYGMELLDGTYSPVGNYGYGYNGMEKDDELKDGGNVINFEAREYNSESGFWSRDPLEMKYPGKSPYIYAGNNPILNVDDNGLELRNYSQLINVSRAIKLLDKTELGRKVLNFFRESQKYHAHINDADLSKNTPENDEYYALTTSGKNLDNFTYNGIYNFQKSKLEISGEYWLYFQQVFGEAFDGINEIEGGRNGLIALANVAYNNSWFSGSKQNWFADRQDLGRNELIYLAESLFHELFSHLFFYMNLKENENFNNWLKDNNIIYDNDSDKVKIQHDYYNQDAKIQILQELNNVLQEIIDSIINDSNVGSTQKSVSKAESKTEKEAKKAR